MDRTTADATCHHPRQYGVAPALSRNAQNSSDASISYDFSVISSNPREPVKAAPSDSLATSLLAADQPHHRFTTLQVSIFFLAAVIPASLICSAFFMFRDGGRYCLAQVCPEMRGFAGEMRSSLVGFYVWLAFMAVFLAIAQHTNYGHGHSWKHKCIHLFAQAPSMRKDSSILNAGRKGWRVSYSEIAVWALVALHQCLQFTYWYIVFYNRDSKFSDLRARRWRAGYRAIAFPIGIQVSLALLPISRNSLLAALFRISYDHALSFHRISGILTVILSFVHAIGFAIYLLYRTGDMDAFWRVVFMIGASPTQLRSYRAWLGPVGLLSLLLFVWVAINSLSWFRRRHFNWFWINHFAVLGAIILAMIHASPMFYFALPTLSMYLIDSCVRTWNTRLGYTVSSITTERCGYLRLDIDDCQITSTPGQWVSLCIPSISKAEWHPFTVARCCPKPSLSPSSYSNWKWWTKPGTLSEMQPLLSRERDTYTDGSRGIMETKGLSLIIKPSLEYSSWTQAIAMAFSAHAALDKALKVRIDGPYGTLPPKFLLSDQVIVVVGGSGVPGGLSIVRAVLDGALAARSSSIIRPTQKVRFWWSCREADAGQMSLYRELFLHPLAEELLDARLFITSRTMCSSENVGDVHALPSQDLSPTITHARMDLPAMFSTVFSPTSSVLSVYTCGPTSLTESVRCCANQVGAIVERDGHPQDSLNEFEDVTLAPPIYGTDLESNSAMQNRDGGSPVRSKEDVKSLDTKTIHSGKSSGVRILLHIEGYGR
ncbi:hypothetical protein DFS34DRAFT_171494 [Phlyctochytrium arcticum]|nr:hypothetical protein DFS34DRAFT_171494 [Phlyctochytrium arcticum]